MTREECIKQASSYIKITPYPNPNQFTKWYYGNNKQAYWCGIFIDYVIKHDLNCNWLDDCKNFAYVPTIYEWAKSKGYYTKDFTKAKKGDLVLFSFDTSRPDHLSHIGIVESVTKDTLTSVDGNTKNDKYDENCVARRTRNKKYINGVIILPYGDDNMFDIGDEVVALEDVKLYTTVECKESNYTIKKGQKAYVRLKYGDDFIALADIVTGEFFKSAWTKEQNKFKLNEVDYQILYEEQLLINKELQAKIDKAIEDLK